MMRVEGGRTGPFEDRKPSEEEEQQQPEKKRPGEEGCHFEEEPKRQRTEDDDDDVHDFYEGDSDDDKDDDFMSNYKLAEYGDWKDGTEPDADEKDEDRKCLKVRRCHKYQHAEKFDGLPFFEIFSIKLRLNDKYISSAVEGPLYGVIEVDTTDDLDLDPIPYYRVSQRQMEADSIALKLEPGKKLNLPLYGFEFRPPLADYCKVHLNSVFKFKNEEIFLEAFPEERPELFYDDGKGNCAANSCVVAFRTGAITCRRIKYAPFISRNMLWSPEISRILIAAYCSIYFGALATVQVKILKEGVSSCYGFIYARPCIFSKRIRLLSLQSNQKLEQSAGSLKLTRSVVAVPSYSSLIIAADLYDQDGEQIIRGKTFFPAKERGRTSKYIEDKNRVPILEVIIEWECKT